MIINSKIRYVGVNDRIKTAFEGLWPLPFGVSYNSYLVIGDKIALVDTVEHGFENEYLEKIAKEIGDKNVDYLIVNHMEPDHSSLVSAVKQRWPQITIVTTAKAVPMLAGFQGVTEGIITVKDKDVLDLGGCTLQFYLTPMVHWPETMMTYLVEEKTLFSGDAFGCFGAMENGITDSEAVLYNHVHALAGNAFEDFRDEMIRYYSNIVGKYGQTVQAALKKLSSLEIGRICSTHGPVWEKNVTDVVQMYDRLSRYEAERGVCIVYGSMYGNTEKAAQALAAGLQAKAVPFAIHNLCEENPSFAYRDAFKYDTIAAGAPTYNNDIFPPVCNYLYGLSSRLIKNRRFIAFGSYTWAAASVRLMNEIAQKQGWTQLGEGFSFPHGYQPDKCDWDALDI